MKLIRTSFSIIFVLITQFAFSQNSFKAIVRDEKSDEILIGVNAIVKTTNIGAISDINGEVIVKNIPNGTFTIEFSYIGYKSYQQSVTFPLTNPEKIQVILLELTVLEFEGIIVTTTRTNNRIEDVPIRVEVLGSEEVKEEIAIKPGNISKLLGETSGIQVQQTSATSGNVSFRIQGLPGKYTQLLKDGFPVYSGFSSGLSLLQIPPLDLKQVEVIKGSASALYGGDAIAGIVNLVSKNPTKKPEWSVLFNQTQKGGRDISSFYSNRKDKIGVTFLASQSIQKAIDVNENGFTDLPQFQQTTLYPKLFYYFNDSTDLLFGISSSFENRVGGDIFAIENAPDSPHVFIEKNKSNRITSQLMFEKKFKHYNTFIFKNSFSNFQRNISVNSANFNGNQISSYSELSILVRTNKHNTVLGLNLITDAFNENKADTEMPLDYNCYTTGLFAQDDWNLNKRFILQTGIRSDYHNKYGVFILPRFSVLHKITNNFYLRIGSGFGYKTPTVFTSEAEAKGYKNVLPIGEDKKAENSQGVNVDINYKTIIFKNFAVTLNQAFYYTNINNALISQPDSLLKGILSYENANAPLETRGFDTNITFALDELALFIDYTYTDAQKRYDNAFPNLELTPKHKLNMTLTYEEEDSWRMGIEAFYTGKQYLEDGTQTPDYWFIGFMLQKTIGNFSLIGNIENIFDVRQTRFEDVIIPPFDKPTFRQIYAPLDGTVANVVVQIKL